MKCDRCSTEKETKVKEHRLQFPFNENFLMDLSVSFCPNCGHEDMPNPKGWLEFERLVAFDIVQTHVKLRSDSMVTYLSRVLDVPFNGKHRFDPFYTRFRDKCVEKVRSLLGQV